MVISKKGFQAHEAGRGRLVSSTMETPRPRGDLEKRIFKRAPFDYGTTCWHLTNCPNS